MWDHEIRSAAYDHFGDVAYLRNDGYRDRVPLASIDVFQGSGDFTFHAVGLIQRHTRRLTLAMEKLGVTYEFTWNLVDRRTGGDDDVTSANPAY